MIGGTTPPVVLTIAGSDSSGGAGIQADLKTFMALGVHGTSAITAVTAQNTRGVMGIHAVPAGFVEQQIRAVAADFTLAAVKTGMLGTRETVVAVASSVAALKLGPFVVDPVLAATSGDALIEVAALDALRTKLLPLAALVTPNLDEAACLLDESPAQTVAGMEKQAAALLTLGPKAVLVKGGHGTGATATDVLATSAGTQVIELPRLAVTRTHGTGCTLSAAIAAFLALGKPLHTAVAEAKRFVWNAIDSARLAPLGHGALPVDHAHAVRAPTPP